MKRYCLHGSLLIRPVAAVVLLAGLLSCNNPAGNDPMDSLSLLAPPADTSLSPGTSTLIRWHASHMSSVELVLVSGKDQPEEIIGIASKTDADWGQYSWTVPFLCSDNCRLIVRDTAGSAADTSEAFTIQSGNDPCISVRNVGVDGEVLQDSTFPVLWTSAGVSSVTINLSEDNGSTWKQVTAVEKSDDAWGCFYWNVPFTFSMKCFLRIDDPTGRASATSKQFAVVDTWISIKTPKTGAVVRRGQTCHITFDAKNIGGVNIYCSTDEGLTFDMLNQKTIITGADMWGDFRWDVPMDYPPTDRARIYMEGYELESPRLSGPFTIE